MPENKSPSKKEQKGFPFATALTVCLLASVLFFLLIALISFVSLKSSVDGSMYLPLSVGAGAVTGFLCGFTLSAIKKEKGLILGAMSGFLHSLICSSVIFVLNKGVAGNGIFILMAVITICSSLGGILAVNIKKKIRY